MPALEHEVTILVRSNPLACIDIPEALDFLVGERLDPTVRRDLRVNSSLVFWRKTLTQPLLVPPIVDLGSADHCYLFL